MNQFTWILKMAARDSRGSRKRLALYLSAMVLGVAALVAIDGFGTNLERTIDQEAKTLLGADLKLEREQAFSDSTETMIDTLGGEQSRRISFGTMAYFPQQNGTRLASIRALEGGYPFYGTMQTEPASAADTYQADGAALVDRSLMRQFGAAVGDSVRIGGRTYPIAGQLLQVPGESAAISSIAPRIYIPRADV